MDTVQWGQTEPSGNEKSFFTGLQTCGLGHVCPICTRAKAIKARDAINDGLAAARKRGGIWPIMLTLTVRHGKRDNAKHLVNDLIKAEQYLRDKTPWRKMDRVAYSRVLEWMYGDRGHHPHFHMLLLIKAEDEVDAIRQVERLRETYLRGLESVGRDGHSKAAREHAFQVQGAAAVGRYMTKWGLAEEITGGQAKEGEGLSQWQLLRQSWTAKTEKDRARYAAIWWEIVSALRDKVALFKDAGWNALVKEYRAESEPKPEPEPRKITDYGQRQKGEVASERWLIGRHKTLALREAAEVIGDSDARRFFRVSEAFHAGATDRDLIEKMQADERADLVEDESKLKKRKRKKKIT